MRKRNSRILSQLKRELHQRAIKEQDEKKRTDYWRMYFAAKNAEAEVRELVLEAEKRRLIEFLREDGYDGDLLDGDDDPPPDNPSNDDDDEIPPRQKGLWD